MPEIKFIAAIDDKRGIAKSKPGTAGIIPWKLPGDHKYFMDKLHDGPVLSGWNTFRANGLKPFGVGANYILTRKDTESYPGVWIIHDLAEFFAKNVDDVWVAGGGQVFAEALPHATHLYLTRVSGDFDCDVFFPSFEDDFRLQREEPELVENGIKYKYQVWVRR
nr:Dihydrofolate reductase [uncultured bacterium]